MSELLGDPLVDDSTNLAVNLFDVIVGTNFHSSSDYQMKDPILKWLKTMILELEASNGKINRPKKADMISVQRKLMKLIFNFEIIKDLIYFIDKDEFGMERKRYVMPKNEIISTIQELQCKETAGHLGAEKTIEKIQSRFFWISLNSDVRKFVKECFSCQKVKPPKQSCKIDAFDSKQNVVNHNHGHGRSIARNTKRKQKHHSNM